MADKKKKLTSYKVISILIDRLPGPPYISWLIRFRYEHHITILIWVQSAGKPFINQLDEGFECTYSAVSNSQYKACCEHSY